MQTFFSADLHLQHGAILGYCPGRSALWSSVEEMNEGIIDNWNATVGTDDNVIVLGDLCMGQREKSLPLLGRLNGNISLIPGNHDHVHPMYSDAKREKWIPLYRQYVYIMHIEHRDFRLNDDIWVDLCHFPYFGDHTVDERYGEWRPKDDGRWLIHGHVHDLWRVSGKQINVGIDVNDYRPVHIDQLIEIIEAS